MERKIRKGEVYISKNGDQSYALIVDGFDGQRVIIRDSSSRDTEHDFVGYTSEITTEKFLELYERATPKQIEPLIRDLKERRNVIDKKIIYLEGFAQPKFRMPDKEDIDHLINSIEDDEVSLGASLLNPSDD